MKTSRLLALMAALLAISGAVFAVPSLSGPTGLLTFPTADIAPQGQLNLTLNHLGEYGPYLEWQAGTGAQLLYGVTNKAEIGFIYLDQSETADGPNYTVITLPDHNFSVNAKYQTPVKFGRFDWSLGGIYQRISVDYPIGTTYDIYSSLYGVGTREFAFKSPNLPKLDVTVGVHRLRWENHLGWTSTEYCPFAGLEVRFGSKLSLIAESMKSKEERLSSVGIRWPFSDSLTGQIGLSECSRGLFFTGESKTVVGLNYAFGGH